MEPLTQPDYLDGKIIQLPDAGGFIQLEENGTTYRCTATPDVTEKLRLYFNGPTIRGFGTAEWLRERDGQWVLRSFSIENFTTLDDNPLDQVLK